MTLLIVTAWYHPFIHPRAHRWTALAEYWTNEGHDIHVLTARHRDCPDEAAVNGVHVHRAGFDSLKELAYFYWGSKNARGRVGAGLQKPGFFTHCAGWLYNAFWKKIYFPDDACLWYFPAKRKARQLLETQRFDALITVSLPFTGHLIGLALAPKTHASIQNRSTRFTWLADIGDPFSIQNKPLNNRLLYGKFSGRLEQKVLESAGAATVTTEFTLKKYREQFGEKAVAKMSVIPPLLHPAPDSAIFKKPPDFQPQSPIKLGYFGALYVPMRTPDAFLDLLERSRILHPDLGARIEAHFYGEIFPEFYRKLGTEPSVRLHGLCSREAAQAAMQEMDVLLNIGNASDFQLPSKAAEYLAAGKPVLNLSYTDDDPFAAFFGDNPLILNIKVKNGRVGEGELRRWLAWLEGGKKAPDKDEMNRRVAPYRVEAIAQRYRDALGC